MTSLKKKLESTPEIWVNGVITQINAKGKVVYLSIADFDEGDVKPKATMPLVCFSSRYEYLQEKINNCPEPFTLREQLKVNVLIKAELYIPSGKLQAQILDIDPVYTIGELALTKAAILKRLVSEGLVHKNKSLPLAYTPVRIGLITGEGTAAFKDFTTKLKESPYLFKVKNAFAKMQGDETEASILRALEILRQDNSIDVVCIIRGGGAKTDLNFFDSEALCRAVANYPIPVFTGIGHEIDKSLLDEVAYLSCITPTDTAKKIIERVEESWNNMVTSAQELATKSKDYLTVCNQDLTAKAMYLQKFVTRRIQDEKTKLAVSQNSMQKNLQYLFKSERDLLRRNIDGLKQGSRKILDLAKSNFALFETKVKNADPATTLAKGYSLTLDSNGKFIRNATQVKSGDRLITRFKDGNVESVVT